MTTMATTAATASTIAADGDEARWRQWRLDYAASSRKTDTQMRTVFVLALLAVVGVLARAFLS